MTTEKILITGATGFIGKELITKLKDRYEIHTLERYVTGRYEKLQKKATAYARSFTWEKTARETLEVYKKVLEK